MSTNYVTMMERMAEEAATVWSRMIEEAMRIQRKADADMIEDTVRFARESYLTSVPFEVALKLAARMRKL